MTIAIRLIAVKVVRMADTLDSGFGFGSHQRQTAV
jgi:hypothetical protein